MRALAALTGVLVTIIMSKSASTNTSSDAPFSSSAVTSLSNSPPLDRGPLIFLAIVSFFVSLNLFQKGYRLFVPVPLVSVDGTTTELTTIVSPLLDIEQGHFQAIMDEIILSEQLEEALRRKWMVNDLVSLYNASRLDVTEPRNLATGQNVPHMVGVHPRILAASSDCDSIQIMLAKYRPSRASSTSRFTAFSLEFTPSLTNLSSSTIDRNDERATSSDISVSLSLETGESYATAPGTQNLSGDNLRLSHTWG
ncbi:hypothetical protein L218DRAFT_549110 [Marasmius fiardii PR-910]|nr:hypothetical protein L218DRAFT_549110 [Marasmius fiardii PR-910]